MIDFAVHRRLGIQYDTQLTQELQNDAKVMQVIVDEAGVLRLCRSFGMTMSGGCDRTSSSLASLTPARWTLTSHLSS